MPTDSKNALYGQDTDFHILATLIPHVTSKTFIDIGAEKGEVAKFLMSHGFDGCLFEPLPKHFQALRSLVSQTNSQFFSYAIDDHDHRATLHIATDENNLPMDYFHSLQRLEGDQRVHHNEQLQVECFSIASLIAQGKITDQIGVLKTDTEGNDLNVIVGMGNIQPEVLICEFFTEGLYSGWEDAHPEKLIAAAKTKGYNHYISIKRREGMETTAIGPCSFIDRQWGNLVFMKESVYYPSLEGLLKIIQQSEQKLFDEVADLRKNCMERLKIINSLVYHSTENTHG